MLLRGRWIVNISKSAFVLRMLDGTWGCLNCLNKQFKHPQVLKKQVTMSPFFCLMNAWKSKNCFSKRSPKPFFSLFLLLYAFLRPNKIIKLKKRYLKLFQVTKRVWRKHPEEEKAIKRRLSNTKNKSQAQKEQIKQTKLFESISKSAS